MLDVAGIVLHGELTVGDLIVGGGTLALAGFTAWLAYRTSQEVDITRRSVGAAEEGVRAQDRPFVVATPAKNHRAIEFVTTSDEEYGGPEKDLPPASWRFVFRLWNMGKGPAIVTSVAFFDRERQLLAENEHQILVEAPGVSDQWRQLLHPEHVPEPQEEGCKLRIRYKAASGVDYETTSLVEVDEGGVCRCRDFVQRTGDTLSDWG